MKFSHPNVETILYWEKSYYINKYITNVNPWGRDRLENTVEKNFSVLLKLQVH